MRRYVKNYDLCQRMKNYTELLAENLIANNVLEKLWIYLIVNFITKLLLVVGKDAILVVYNRFIKDDVLCNNNKGDISRRVG